MPYEKIDSAEQFVELRSSQNPEDYHRAADGEASEDIWYEVIERFPDYAKWVAHNKTIPESVIRSLSLSSNPSVRFYIAMKRKTPKDVMIYLAKDEDESVRRNIVYNAKCPRDALFLLAKDENEEIKNKAIERLANM